MITLPSALQFYRMCKLYEGSKGGAALERYSKKNISISKIRLNVILFHGMDNNMKYDTKIILAILDLRILSAWSASRMQLPNIITPFCKTCNSLFKSFFRQGGFKILRVNNF